MLQSLNEIRQALQQNIFAHPSSTQFNSYSKAVLHKLANCHTIGIGKHHYQCNNKSCNHLHYQYHSCGNRHCMNCGGMKKEQWIQDRMNELLPTYYYHIVFTLPQQLRSLCMGNRKLLFNLLFEASHYTLTKLGANKKWLGAQPGIVSILHTNGQDLVFHPHIHCIVSGGGVDSNNKWIKEKRNNGKFLFPRSSLEKTYKDYFLKRLALYYKSDKLKIKCEDDFQKSIIDVSQIQWNVYAKAPFGGPAQIVEYLGRYTHKVAITAHRITEITDTQITFKYKDYKDNDKVKLITLSNAEFLRRFEQHILPRGFVKIRHAGYLRNRNKLERINKILSQLNLPKAKPKVAIPVTTLILIKTGKDVSACPKCETGKLIRMATYINVNGKLINTENINSRGSPLKRKTITP